MLFGAVLCCAVVVVSCCFDTDCFGCGYFGVF